MYCFFSRTKTERRWLFLICGGITPLSLRHVSCFQLRIHTGQRWHIRVTLYAFYINAHSKLSNQRIGNLARIWSSVHFKMASQRGKMFRSKLPSEPHNVVDSTDSEESEELDSTVSTLSVDEDGPNETQPETMPVSLKRAIEWSYQGGSQKKMLGVSSRQNWYNVKLASNSNYSCQIGYMFFLFIRVGC